MFDEITKWTQTLHRSVFICLIAVPPVLADMTVAQQDDFLSVYGNDEFISLATGRALPQFVAPAVATVITQRDIIASGADTLEQAIETVPGLHVSTNNNFYNPIYQIRGVTAAFNPHVLLMIDGVSMSNVWYGNRGLIWMSMPVSNIDHIEIIRGPGSALHGSDAFAGTINVVTKNYATADRASIKLGANSQHNMMGNVIGKWHLGDFDFNASVDVYKEKSLNRSIESDAQTVFDQVFSTQASLAPGNVNTQKTGADVFMKAVSRHWNFAAFLMERRDAGTGAGGAEALDNKGLGHSRRIGLDASYDVADLLPGIDVNVRVNERNAMERAYFYLFPAGAFANTYPDGVIGAPSMKENRLHGEMSVLFKRWERQQIRFGLGGTLQSFYDLQEQKNFDGSFMPLGSVVDATGNSSLMFAQERSRKILFAYLQDEYTITSHWLLTAGIRSDFYSDFGFTHNPRAALVWLPVQDISMKWLYGRAFRAPSFGELYVTNNPVHTGNPNLKPETIQTFEWQIAYSNRTMLGSSINIFYNQLNELIEFVAVVGEPKKVSGNVGEQTAYGAEFESWYRPADSLRVVFNAAWLYAYDKRLQARVANVPTRSALIRLESQLSDAVRMNLQTNYAGSRYRQSVDTRPKINDSIQTDLNVSWKIGKEKQALTLVGQIKNLFDADIREPSFADSVLKTGRIAGDLPMAGRVWQMNLQYAIE